MVFNTRIKVIIGFILAVMLIIGVSTVTYLNVNNLLGSVESLSVPNEKLRELNYLLADVYQLDKTRYVNAEHSDSAKDDQVDYISKIHHRIASLKTKAKDAEEKSKIESIGFNVTQLMEVHNGLEEVKQNLLKRNFSREALNNIERKIRRKEELGKLQNLGRMRAGANPGNGVRQKATLGDSTQQEQNQKPLLQGIDKQQMADLMNLMRVNINRKGQQTKERITSSDSIIYAIRNIVMDINNEERYLRSKLAAMEFDLTNKNKDLIINIQEIITALQQEAVEESQDENAAAISLANRFSTMLGVLTLIGIFGAFGFVYTIVREINQSESYQSKLKEAKERSDNLAKAKQDFLANMSHEIRNPLHVIQGYSEALRKTTLEPKQKEFVSMIRFSSETLLGIVNDILDFSKLEAGKIKIELAPFDPNKLFLNIKRLFDQKAFEKDLRVNLNLALTRDKWLIGDQLRIKQILNNLLSNAIKFTDKGEINIFIRNNASTLTIEVEDSGMGMNQETKKKLFSAFQQGDDSITRKFGGTGLGLAIVKRLVDLQKGKIEFKSEPDKGTVFTVYLPTQITEPGLVASDILENQYSLKGLHVLLVDDDPIGLKFTDFLLSQLGAKVTQYIGGVELRDRLTDDDRYDLVLLDIQMPEVSGYDALKIIKGKPHLKNVPAIALTANVFAKDKEKLEAAGFDGLVLKPFKESDLLTEIVKLVNLSPVKASNGIKEPLISEDSPFYDLSELSRFCMGDETILFEIVSDFYSHTCIDLLKINKAVDQQDYETVKSIAHQLNSRLAQLKISACSIARGIESDIKKDNTDNIQEKVWQLTEIVHQVLDKMSKDYEGLLTQ